MSGNPVDKPDNKGGDLDFELDLDNLDDAALQRLLEEDPALEEEIRQLDLDADDAEPKPEPPADQIGKVAARLREAATSPGVIHAAAEEPPPEPEADHGGENVFADFEDDPPYEDQLSERRSGEDAPFVAAPEHDDLAEYDYTEDEQETVAPPPATDDLTDAIDAPLDFRPVPRINIHAFCLSEKMTSLLEQAAADRRLAKAHVTLQAGDAFHAAELFSQEATPNLLIVEAGDSPQELLRGLDKLAQVCDPSTRVLIVGYLNDIRLYRELIDRGISDYIVAPKSPLQIISVIGGLYADPSAPPIGKTYVFVGARGGSGSSTVCHNVSWALAEAFRSDTVLVDLDLPFGTASLDFEQDPSQGLAEALSAPERLDDVLLDRLLQKCTDRLALFAAPNALERDYEHGAENFEAVIDMVKGAAPCVTIDLPHLWSPWAKMLLQTADEIVLTATPDLSSFRNAKNIVEAVKAARTNDSPPILVLNQAGVPKRPEVPADQFEEALGLAPRAVIPWDPVGFGVAATNAEALLETNPKAKASQEMMRVAELLLGREADKGKGGGFSLKSLFAKSK